MPHMQPDPRWAKLAREGHEVAWEFEKPGGGYTGRLLIDGQHVGSDEEVLTVCKRVTRSVRGGWRPRLRAMSLGRYLSTLSFTGVHPPISIHRIPHLFSRTVAKVRIPESASKSGGTA